MLFLQDFVFVIIDVKVWCNVEEEQMTIPAEIGVAKVSLDDGIMDFHSAIIHHGKIPRG